MYISGTFNKTRGYGFINNVFFVFWFFYFLGNPILNRLSQTGKCLRCDGPGGAGVMFVTTCFSSPVFFNPPEHYNIVNWTDPSHKQLGPLCEPVASENWTEDPSGFLFPSFSPDVTWQDWTFKSTLCLSNYGQPRLRRPNPPQSGGLPKQPSIRAGFLASAHYMTSRWVTFLRA